MLAQERKYASIVPILFVSFWIVAFDNFSFFKQLLKAYPFEAHTLFVLSAVAVLFLVFVLVFVLLGWRYTLKPVLILFLILASVENYFMTTYHVLIDETMIENALQTDLSEASDLMNWRFFAHLLGLGVLPSWLVFRMRIDYGSFRRRVVEKLKTVAAVVMLIVAFMYPLSDYYASFFREHRVIRFYTNPLHGIASLERYLRLRYRHRNVTLQRVGTDAHIETKDRKRRIVIMVVGEAVRADHFGLNGYAKETTPLLAREDIINFTDISSCGTTTAVSVPCMFSVYDRGSYDTFKGLHTENALDVLHRAGVEVLWRDNNSNSKGVTERLGYVSYKTPEHNSVCIEGECRDEGMLVGLEEIVKKSDKDMIVILHQMGNHGPAYYKRYPKAFERFSPVCRTNQLESCTKEEISNAYDNAIVYTDYFLSKAIAFLKSVSDNADTALLYISDHGESLGENGLYLHGMPYFMAPEAQTHVPMVLWFSKGFPVDREKLKARANNSYSQDNIFSTLLGLFDVKTKAYDPSKDIIKP